MQMFQLLHNAVIIGIRLLTFASSIRQRAPRDLITLCFIMLCLNILHWKQTLQLTSMNWKHSLIDECRVQFDPSVVDAAISQWNRRLSTCFRLRGAHLKHKFW